VSFPNFRTWKCAPAQKYKCRTNVGESQFDACTADASCSDLHIDEQDSSLWLNGLWSKFIAITNHWDLKISETINDWNKMVHAMPVADDHSRIGTVTNFVNNVLTSNKALMRQGYSSSPLIKRLAWSVYGGLPWANKKVVVVGAGPIGLRFAIEAKLMGANVFVAEMRNSFTRANVMKMWRVAKSDLESIGIGEFAVMSGLPAKCNIALMQHAMMRIALAVGVEVMGNTQFDSVVEANGRWQAKFTRYKTGEVVRTMDFDAIIDGSGTRAAVATKEVCGKVLFDDVTSGGGGSGDKKVAVTANFHRFSGDRDKKWAYGKSEWTAVGAQMWPDKAKVKSKIGGEPSFNLTELVYFQSLLSNYLVLAADAKELANAGVFKDPNIKNIDALVAWSNLNPANLEKAVMKVATEWAVPHDADAGMLAGINKMSIFDFTHLRSSVDPETKERSIIQVLPKPGCDQGRDPKEDSQLVLVVGDGLIAPFWPEGTGMSRGILSVAHAAFGLNGFWKADSDTARVAAIKQADAWAKIGARAMGTDCKGTKCKPEAWEKYMEHGYSGGKVPKHFGELM